MTGPNLTKLRETTGRTYSFLIRQKPELAAAATRALSPSRADRLSEDEFINIMGELSEAQCQAFLARVEASAKGYQGGELSAFNRFASSVRSYVEAADQNSSVEVPESDETDGVDESNAPDEFGDAEKVVLPDDFPSVLRHRLNADNLLVMDSLALPLKPLEVQKFAVQLRGEDPSKATDMMVRQFNAKLVCKWAESVGTLALATLGQVVTYDVAKSIVVLCHGQKMSLGRIYEMLNLQDKGIGAVCKALYIYLIPPERVAGFRRDKFTEAKAHVLDLYLKQKYGPNYSLNKAFLQRAFAGIDPSLVFFLRDYMLDRRNGAPTAATYFFSFGYMGTGESSPFVANGLSEEQIDQFIELMTQKQGGARAEDDGLPESDALPGYEPPSLYLQKLLSLPLPQQLIFKQYQGAVPDAVMEILLDVSHGEKPGISVSKLERLSQDDKVKIFTAALDQVAFGQKIKKIFLDLIAFVIGHLSFTQDGDALLRQIYVRVCSETDVSYVPILRVLHRRTLNPEIIALEADCALYGHWGFRTGANHSRQTERLSGIFAPSESIGPIVLTVDHSSRDDRWRYRKTQSVLESLRTGVKDLEFEKNFWWFIEHIHDVYGAPIHPKQAHRFQIEVIDGVHESLRVSLAAIYQAIGPADKIESLLESGSLFNHAQNRRFTSAEGTLDEYFTYVYGPHYKLNVNLLTHYLKECWDDVLKIRNQDSIPFAEVGAEIKANPFKFIKHVLKLRRELVEDLAIVPAEVWFIYLGERIQRGRLSAHMGAEGKRLVYLPVPGKGVVVDSEADVVKQAYDRTNWQKVVFGSNQKKIKGHDDHVESVAIGLLRQWVAASGMTYETLKAQRRRQSAAKGKWDHEFVGQIHIGRVPVEGGFQDVSYTLSTLFEAVGLNWQSSQAMEPGFGGNPTNPRFYEALLKIGITVPESVHQTRRKSMLLNEWEEESKLRTPVAVSDLSFERFLKIFTAMVRDKANAPEQAAEIFVQFEHSLDERKFDAESTSFLKEGEYIEIAYRDAFAELRKRLAAAKKGLADSLRITKVQANSLITDEEMIAAIQFYVFNFEAIQKVSEDKAVDLLDQAQLRGVLQAIGDDANDVATYLSQFDQELINRYGLDELVQRFIGLEVNRDNDAERLRNSSPEREELFTQAILDQLAFGGANLDTEALRRIEFIYRRILRKWVEREPEEALYWILQRRQDIPHPALKTVFDHLFDYFEAFVNFKAPEIMTTEPYPYQLEAIRYFSEDDHKRGILADEPGMGKSLQAIGVAESVQAEKILWVTTNSNKETVRQEILEHTANDPGRIVILSGESDTLRKQLRALDGKKYLIINYEAMRQLEERDPQGYQLLMDKLDIAIIDEAQIADNAEVTKQVAQQDGTKIEKVVEKGSQQGNAIQKIVAERMLLLSATPVQNKFERYYNLLRLVDPQVFSGEYGDRQVFIQKYAKRGAQGLLELHHLLQKYMLRRRKHDVFSEADPARPLDEQKKVLPKKIEVPYEVSGGFFMSQEQAELYAFAVADFDGFVEEHAVQIIPEETLDGITFEEKKNEIKSDRFRKLDILFKILYHPQTFGLRNPRIEALKDQARGLIMAGKKPILWAHHQDAVADLMQAMRELSDELRAQHPDKFLSGFQFGRFDGSDEAKADVFYNGERMMARDVDRLRFQQSLDSEPLVMIASLEAGGVGLTMTAGDTAIFYEQPLMATRLIQAYDRIHRADGRFPRYRVEYFRMVAQFPPGFLETIEDEDLRELLSKGTVDQNLYARLQSMVKQHLLALDGAATEEDLNTQIRNDLLGSVELKLDEARKQAQKPIFRKGRAARVEENGRVLIDAYRSYQHSGQKQVLAQIVELFAEDKVAPEDFVRLLGELGEGESTQRALTATLSIRKKYYAQQFFYNLLPLINRVHAAGTTLSSLLDAHFASVLNDDGLSDPVRALALPLLGLEKDPLNPRASLVILKSLAGIRDRAYQMYWAGRLFVGLNHLTAASQSYTSLDLLEPFIRPFWQHDQDTQEIMAEAFYLWCQIVPHFRPKTLLEMIAKWDSPHTARESLIHASWGAVAGLWEVEAVPESVRTLFGNQPHRILASFNSLLTQEKGTKSIELLGEYFAKLCKGASPSEARRVLSRSSAYVRSAALNALQTTGLDELLNRFETEHVTTYAEIVSNESSARRQREWVDEQGALMQKRLYPALVERYGHHAAHILKTYLLADVSCRQILKADLVTLKLKKDGATLTSEESEFLQQMGLAETEFLQHRAVYQELFDVCLRWTDVLVDLAGKAYTPKLARALSGALSHFGIPDETEGHDAQRAFLSAAESMKMGLDALVSESPQTLKNVKIYDTNNPAILMSLGDFHLTVSNCLASDGAPHHLAALPLLLGSRTHRAIVAEVDGKIMAMNLIKIRADANGRPSYYLEHTKFAGFYDFRNEFVAHMIAKGQANAGSYHPKYATFEGVSAGLMGAYEPLSGLGGYGEREFEEAVYNVQGTTKLQHKAKIIYDPMKSVTTLQAALPEGVCARDRLAHLGVLAPDRRARNAIIASRPGSGGSSGGVLHVHPVNNFIHAEDQYVDHMPLRAARRFGATSAVHVRFMRH